MTTDPKNLPSDLITVKEAARLAHNTHQSTIRRWVLSGKMPGYRLAGRKFLVSRADVLAMIQPAATKVFGIGPSGAKVNKANEEAKAFLRSRGIY